MVSDGLSFSLALQHLLFFVSPRESDIIGESHQKWIKNYTPRLPELSISSHFFVLLKAFESLEINFGQLQSGGNFCASS
jgi:hypothetical protein